MTATVITADRVLVGPAATMVGGGAVLLDADRIVAVGPTPDVLATLEHHGAQLHLDGEQVQTLDFPGCTITPGLIDAHVHLAFDGSADPVSSVVRAGPDELLLAMAGRAARLLSCGVTTARDLGDRGRGTLTLRDAIARGDLEGPRLFAATTPLTSRRGHCWFLGGEVDTPEQIDDLIDANAAAGADLIKVMASGGALTPGGPSMWEGQFDRTALDAVVARARHWNLPVAAHAHGTHTITDCVQAGVSTIEHCSWRTESELLFDEGTVGDIIARDVAVCRCVSGDWRLFLQQLGDNAPPLVDAIQRMRAAGVRFIGGTDAGVPGARFDDYVGMLEFFEEVGFTRPEILDMATGNAATALGLHDTGHLTAGARADLLVVAGDPVTEIGALRRLELVVAGGRPTRARWSAARACGQL